MSDDIGAPLAELCGTDGVNSIAHRNDCIKVVEQRVAPNLSRTFLLNYRDFLGSCLLVQFIRVIYVLQMQTDVVSGTIEKHSHGLLRSPHCFIFFFYIIRAVCIVLQKIVHSVLQRNWSRIFEFGFLFEILYNKAFHVFVECHNLLH